MCKTKTTTIKEEKCLEIKEIIMTSLKEKLPTLHFAVGRYENEYGDHELLIRWEQ